MDEALAALLAQHRKVEIDAAYSAYDEHPIDEAGRLSDDRMREICDALAVAVACSAWGGSATRGLI